LNQLDQKIEWIKQLDKLKLVIRKTYLLDESRLENAAEHSWQSALMALVLIDHANENVNLLKVMKMLLIHDVAESIVGDTLHYQKSSDTSTQEQAEAQRLFSKLPSPMGEEMFELWLEFELRDSPEAKYCHAVDRLLPMLNNAETAGRAWKENQVNSSMVLEKNAHIEEGSSELWEYTQKMIHTCVEKGDLPEA